MKINAIKANGVEYDIWATSAEVEALNNQGNAALGKELSSGKQSIVDAINNAGVEASADESLSKLAEYIEQIPIVNVSAFKFSSVPNLAKQIAEQTYSVQLGEDFREKLTEIDDVNGEITRVGSYAFNGCSNLTSVNLPSVTSIGQRVFTSCPSLKSINLPECVSITPAQYFAHNSNTIEKVYLPKLTSVPGVFFLSNCSPNIIDIRNSAITLFDGSNSNLSQACFRNVDVKHLIISSANCNLGLQTSGSGVRRTVFCGNTFKSLIKLELNGIYDRGDIMLANVDNFNLGGWTASTYLVDSADQWENRLTLYTNLLEYTLKKLYDHSADGVTRNFRLGFYTTLLADSQLTTEPYGSELTPLIKAAAQACLTEADNRGWTLSA